jgi:hypothetical protein
MKVTILPVPDRLIFMHDRDFGPVPPEGAEVELDATYRRAIAAGDITIKTETTAPATSEPAEETADKAVTVPAFIKHKGDRR